MIDAERYRLLTADYGSILDLRKSTFQGIVNAFISVFADSNPQVNVGTNREINSSTIPRESSRNVNDVPPRSSTGRPRRPKF